MTGDIHEIAARETRLATIFFVQQNDAAAVMNAAITVLQAVDCGVVLIMAANGHHQKLATLQTQAGKGTHTELRFPARRREHALPNRVGKLKSSRLAHPLIE